MTFCYSPRSQPGPSSVLRQQAYATGTLAPGPLDDPAGWHSVTPLTKIKGKLSSGRLVELVCSVSREYCCLIKFLTFSSGFSS